MNSKSCCAGSDCYGDGALRDPACYGRAFAGDDISMGGHGAWRGNIVIERLWPSVKYEEDYLDAYDTLSDSRAGIGRCFNLYNRRRPHLFSAAVNSGCLNDSLGSA